MSEHVHTNKIDRDRRDEGKIDLYRLMGEFITMFGRFFWIPLALIVLFSAQSCFHAWRNYTPMYRASVSFTVGTTAQSGGSDISTVSSYYNKTTAEQLSKTFPYIINSSIMHNSLLEELGTEYLNGSVTCQTVPETNLFSLDVTSSNPQDAYDILNAVTVVYPRIAANVIGPVALDVLTPAEVPTEPYNSRYIFGGLKRGAVTGAGLGILFILGFALTRRTVQEEKEIRDKLNQVSLGAVPEVKMKKRTDKTVRKITILDERVSPSFQENIRKVRNKLLREIDGKNIRTILVTSTVPGEGKTTTSVNLALSLCDSGKKVILVDMDLRHPSIKKTLNIQTPSKGIGELFDTDLTAADALIPVPGTTLRILAGDTAVDEPRKKSASAKMARYIRQLRDEADIILLDTPPSGLLADSAAAAKLADGVIYVVRSDIVQIPHILDSIQFLGDSGTKIIGCVLNGVKRSHGSYGYGYYGYGSGYGYGKGFGYGGGYGHQESKLKSRFGHYSPRKRSTESEEE